MHEYFRLINDFLPGHRTGVLWWCLYFCREQTSVTSSQQLELVITGSHSPAVLSLSIVNISTRFKFSLELIDKISDTKVNDTAGQSGQNLLVP